MPHRGADGGGGRVDQPATAYARGRHGLGAIGMGAYDGGRHTVVPDIDFTERYSPSPKSSAQAVTIWTAGTRVDYNVGVHCWGLLRLQGMSALFRALRTAATHTFTGAFASEGAAVFHRSSACQRTLLTRRCGGIGRSSGLCPRIACQQQRDELSCGPAPDDCLPVSGSTQNSGSCQDLACRLKAGGVIGRRDVAGDHEHAGPARCASVRRAWRRRSSGERRPS